MTPTSFTLNGTPVREYFAHLGHGTPGPCHSPPLNPQTPSLRVVLSLPCVLQPSTPHLRDLHEWQRSPNRTTLLHWSLPPIKTVRESPVTRTPLASVASLANCTPSAAPSFAQQVLPDLSKPMEVPPLMKRGSGSILRFAELIQERYPISVSNPVSSYAPIAILEARREPHLVRALLAPAITLRPQRTGKTTGFPRITHLLKGFLL